MIKCHRGHEFEDQRMWDCPACVQDLLASRDEAYKKLLVEAKKLLVALEGVTRNSNDVANWYKYLKTEGINPS